MPGRHNCLESFSLSDWTLEYLLRFFPRMSQTVLSSFDGERIFMKAFSVLQRNGFCMELLSCLFVAGEVLLSLQDSCLLLSSSSSSFFSDAPLSSLCCLCLMFPQLYPACSFPSASLADLSLTAEVDSMLSIVNSLHSASSLSPKHLGSINGRLQFRTFLCGHRLTLADLALYGQLRRLSADPTQEKPGGGDQAAAAGAPPPAW